MLDVCNGEIAGQTDFGVRTSKHDGKQRGTQRVVLSETTEYGDEEDSLDS